jgi:hypothetical protein
MTNEGFLVDHHPPSLLDEDPVNCSAFIKKGEEPSCLTGMCNTLWKKSLLS